MSSTKLVKKLVEVLGQVQRVTKSGRNTHQHYDYVTEADILEAVRNSLVERGIFVFTSTEVTDVTKIDAVEGKKPSYITTVKATHTFVDSESGESWAVTSVGQGHDALDKGVYKAVTGAMKYLLMKNFLMPTGDDPENDGETPPKGETKPAGGFPAAKTSPKVEAEQPAQPASKPKFTGTKPAFNAPKKEASAPVVNSEVQF